jgi:hypothetical protein
VDAALDTCTCSAATTQGTVVRVQDTASECIQMHIGKGCGCTTDVNVQISGFQ